MIRKCLNCGVNFTNRQHTWHLKNGHCTKSNVQSNIPRMAPPQEADELHLQEGEDDNEDMGQEWNQHSEFDDSSGWDGDDLLSGLLDNMGLNEKIIEQNPEITTVDLAEDSDSEDEDAVAEEEDNNNSDEENSSIGNPYQFNPDEIEGWGEDYLKTRVGEGPGIQGYHRGMAKEMDSEAKSDIELLKILKGYDLSLFKNIREWRHNSQFIYKHDMDPTTYKNSTREKVISHLAERYGLHNLQPKIIKVRLPMLQKDVEIPVFPFGESMVSLLTAPEALDPHNLLIDQTDPFEKPTIGGKNGFLDDINTGSVYVEAHEKHCTGERDINAGIVAFCDKSFVDQKGKLTLEPLMFTLGIFNREFRNKPKAWRPMGYIPNLDHLAPRADAQKKLHDYHFCMNIIMSEMIEYQKLEGINWRMHLNNKWENVRLQIPLLYIIGDTEGHDKMAGRKIDRCSGKNKQCRYCDVDHDDCDKPNTQSELTCKAVIRKLRKENSQASRDELDRLSYRQIDDAFDKVIFADNIRGIHGATPAEVLHAVNLGIHDRVIASLFNMKRVKESEKKNKKKSSQELGRPRKRARTGIGVERESDVDGDADEEEEEDGMGGLLRAEDSNDEEEDEEEEDVNDREEVYEEEEEEGKIYTAPELQTLIKRGIFAARTCDWVDDQCRALHKQLRWQSDTDLPRTNFGTGIASLSKMTGNERTGVLLLLLLVMCIDHMHNAARRANSDTRKFGTKETGYLVSVMGDDMLRNIVKHISLMLLFEAFLKCVKVPIACMKAVKAFVPALMDGIFRTFPRIGGTGHKTIKSHLVSVHMVDDVFRWGSAENYNSGPLESSHIENIKKPGRNTQKRAKDFAVQCSKHYCHNVVIDRAWMDHPKWEGKQEEVCKRHIDISKAWLTVTENKVLSGGPTGDDDPKDSRRTCIKDKLGAWVGSGITKDDLLARIRNDILPCLPKKKQVTVHRTMTLGGQKFQANPEFGREKLARQHWAIVERRSPKQGGGYELREIPVHLQCIICIDETPTIPIEFDLKTSIEEKGYYFLANTIDRELSDTGKNLEEDYGEEWNYGTLAENNQRIIHAATKKQVSGEPIYTGRGRGILKETKRDALIVVPVRAIKSGLVGVLDPNAAELEKRFYFFIARHCNWADLFMEMAVDHDKKENVEDGDDVDEDDDDSHVES